jgi:hypothetical protein
MAKMALKREKKGIQRSEELDALSERLIKK